MYLYAKIRAFSAKILNICSVVTKVQRPWKQGDLITLL